MPLAADDPRRKFFANPEAAVSAQNARRAGKVRRWAQGEAERWRCFFCSFTCHGFGELDQHTRREHSRG